jgi:hypothetical protein
MRGLYKRQWGKRGEKESHSVLNAGDVSIGNSLLEGAGVEEAAAAAAAAAAAVAPATAACAAAAMASATSAMNQDIYATAIASVDRR